MTNNKKDAEWIEALSELFARVGPIEVADFVDPYTAWLDTLTEVRWIVGCIESIQVLNPELHARAVELSAIFDRAADLVATETLRRGHGDDFEAVNHARALFDALTTGNSLRLTLLTREPS